MTEPLAWQGLSRVGACGPPGTVAVAAVTRCCSLFTSFSEKTSVLPSSTYTLLPGNECPPHCQKLNSCYLSAFFVMYVILPLLKVPNVVSTTIFTLHSRLQCGFNNSIIYFTFSTPMWFQQQYYLLYILKSVAMDCTSFKSSDGLMIVHLLFTSSQRSSSPAISG